jgi:drug/metabolite transporter (DMT)-like permease
VVRLPLADAIVLQNATPLLTAVVAWWLLDEAIGWPTAAAIACGIAGVLIIARPSSAAFDGLGVAAALAGVVASSFAYVTVRKLSRTVHPLVIVLYFPLVAAPLTLPWMLASFVVPGPLDAVLLLALGAATQCGQVYLTRGLAIERAGRAMTINYLQVAFAMLWQLLLFGDWPTPWTLAGAGLILGGTVLVAQVTARARPSPPRA